MHLCFKMIISWNISFSSFFFFFPISIVPVRKCAIWLQGFQYNVLWICIGEHLNLSSFCLRFWSNDWDILMVFVFSSFVQLAAFTLSITMRETLPILSKSTHNTIEVWFLANLFFFLICIYTNQSYEAKVTSFSIEDYYQRLMDCNRYWSYELWRN